MNELAELAARAHRLLVPERRVILGITGAPGAGKSTLATALVAELRATASSTDEWVAYVPMDGFHLADTELERLGLRKRKGAPETFDAAGYLNALQRMRAQFESTVYVPNFDRVIEQPIAAGIPVQPETVLVVTEGNYLLHDTGDWSRVREQLDEVWYVDADDAQRREWLIARHVQFGKQPEEARRWVLDSDEPNAELVSHTKQHADLIVRGCCRTDLGVCGSNGSPDRVVVGRSADVNRAS